MTLTLSLEKTAYTAEQLELRSLPQFALTGRSNVGKSSLLNRLGGRKNLARTSATPGKTRSINYYRVEPENFYLVDLPGYGYARCSKTEREKWAQLIEAYLSRTPLLIAVVALLDARLPPQKNDIELISYVSAKNIDIIPVMTKADKCKQKERTEHQNLWENIIHGKKPLFTSSHSGMNIEKLSETLKNRGENAFIPL